jgi:hypothetical protein
MEYNDPRLGKVFILIVHQALRFKELKHDVVVKERPKFLTAEATEHDHAILGGDLLITLELHSVTS